jgi:hypothetical protein
MEVGRTASGPRRVLSADLARPTRLWINEFGLQVKKVSTTGVNGCGFGVLPHGSVSCWSTIRSMVCPFIDTCKIDDFSKPVHSTHGTMFSERMPRIE